MKPIYVTKPSLPEFNSYVEEIRELWDSRYITNMGIKHKNLEIELKSFLGTKGLTLFTNGHLALESSIQVLGLTGEVITTPFTFASTTQAIIRKGLTPVFCDIQEDNFTIDSQKIESLITEKTSAIMPVHIYGNICNVEAIQKIADKYDLKVIYDGAQAFGVKYKGGSIAGFGDVTMYSFHATKVFNTIEGGACTYQDLSMEKSFNGDKNYGITGQESVESIGGNAKMSEFQAAMGLCNLRNISENIKKRKIRYERYLSQLEHFDHVKVQTFSKYIESNYAYLPIVCNSETLRNTIKLKLSNNQIYSRKYFYPLTKDYECYEGKFASVKTPVATKSSNCVLVLPLYPELSLEDIDRICDLIKSC